MPVECAPPGEQLGPVEGIEAPFLGQKMRRQRQHARPQSRAAELRVTLTPVAAGTQVSLATSFEATYHHRYRNTPFTAACASTGALERTLLDAAG